MSLGFNTKVQLNDGLYHVQTEERGAVHPFIDTLVLFNGQVLHRCSRSYEDMLESGALDHDLLRSRVEKQHLEVLGALRGGSLPLEKVALTPALSIKLRNAKSWLAAGKASLDVQVMTRADNAPAVGAEVEACIEGAGRDSATFSAAADKDGCALIGFSLPKITDSESAALVIRARVGEMHEQIRYRLKLKT